jgi:hypothetical protein
MTNPNPQISSEEYELHVTFLFHCAFATQPDGSRTDVLLAPGSVNGAHVMQHIGSLRIPVDCVVPRKDMPLTEALTPQKKRAVTIQKTDTLRATEKGVVTETTRDYVWRLEGYDVWLDPDDNAAGKKGDFPATTNVKFAVSHGDETFVIANLAALGDSRIDPVCLSDDKVPDFLATKGARVRIWGGRLRCEVPEGNLRHRRWDLGRNKPPVGLSDRMDFRKTVTGPVLLRYHRFNDPTFYTVELKPDASGVIRIHVTNDPFVEDMPHGTAGVDPCQELPHFASYGLLLEPAGKVKALKPPPMVALARGAGFQIAEGNSFCCPCGGEP